MMVSAHVNSSQAPRNVKIATIASAGRESGSTVARSASSAAAVDHHRLVELPRMILHEAAEEKRVEREIAAGVEHDETP